MYKKLALLGVAAIFSAQAKVETKSVSESETSRLALIDLYKTPRAQEFWRAAIAGGLGHILAKATRAHLPTAAYLPAHGVCRDDLTTLSGLLAAWFGLEAVEGASADCNARIIGLIFGALTTGVLKKALAL